MIDDFEKALFSWKEGIAAGEIVSFLCPAEEAEEEASKQNVYAGFEEFKEALLNVLCQGDTRNLWKKDVEEAVQV